MSYKCIICTVGTSLLTNKDGRPWRGWKRGDPVPKPEDVVQWLQKAEPMTCSAEINTISRLKEDALIDNTDLIYLVCTDTNESIFCGDIIAKYLEKQGFVTKKETVENLSYDMRNFTEGLNKLINKLIRIITNEKKNSREIIISATGGFKAEAAFITLLGMLEKVEIFYIYENSGSLIRFPKIPLAWDDNFVKENIEFFKWIDEEPRKEEELTSWIRGNPNLKLMLEYCNDGYVYLNPAGNILYKISMAKMEEAVEWPSCSIPPEKKNRVSEVPHHRPEGWENMVNKLCQKSYVCEVRYDNGARNNREPTVVDEGKGTIYFCYRRGDKELPLSISTAACGKKQCELVLSDIKKLL